MTYDADPSGFDSVLLLMLGWTALLMWRTTKQPRAVYLLGFVPLVVASALYGIVLLDLGVARLATITVFASVGAVLLLFGLMMRNQFVRAIKFVFPSARLVRRRR